MQPGPAEGVRDLERAAPSAEAQVAAAVDRERAVRPLRQQIREQSLGESARVELQAGRAAHEAGARGRIVPGRGQAGARRATGAQQREARTLRPRPGGDTGRGEREGDVERHGRAEVGHVARGLDLGHQRAVDEAAGRERRVVDRAQQPRQLGADRDDLTRVAVQARKLGVGQEAREALMPGLELPARAGLVATPDAAASAEAVEPHVAGTMRRVSNAAAGSTTIAAATRNHAAPASLPAMTACTIPKTHASAVQRCSLRHRATPIRERK